MKIQSNGKGHMAAFVTILIWGTTFISTKLLLNDFQPVEILFYRFLIGFGTLCLLNFHRLKETTWKQECMFAGAGLCGICLYYLLENIALTYTSASNVGIIISIAPFFTAMLSRFLLKTQAIHRNFIIGFLSAMVGIVLISLQSEALSWNPFGDVLAIIAAFVWACYSILTKKISEYGYPTILTTRRVFFYGILWMIPALCFFDFQVDLMRFTQPDLLFHILFLGLGASALCFMTWNFAVKSLGAVKTSVYIYMVPVITVVTSMIVLKEEVTMIAAIGICLTLCGLCMSQITPKERRKKSWIKIKNA